MGFIDCASGNSIWRGYDYFNEKKVLSYEHEGGTVYKGEVKGSENNQYHVRIDVDHPRKSSCDCPFAKGRRVVCKHMIALYYTLYPEKAEQLLKEAEEYEAEEELRYQEHVANLEKYVKSLSKAELQVQLLDALLQLEDDDDYYDR